MSTNHAAVAALPQSSAAVKQLLRGMSVAKFPYIVTSAIAAQDLVVVDPWTGDVTQDLMLYGRVFHYDATDTTSAHDGVSVLVSNDGKRYKLAAGTDVIAYSVLDITATPPGSPAIGDAYLCDTASSGDWAGHDDQVAIYTSRGWEFISYAIGRALYIEDEDAYKRRDSGGAWGYTLTVADDSIAPKKIIGKPLRYIVENQTTNTPPGSPSTGDQYIIGSSPTGAWAGSAGKIAIYEGSAWGIYTAALGWAAYDKALTKDLIFNGSAWIGNAGTSVLIYVADYGGGSSIDLINGTSGVILDTTYNEYLLHLSGLKTASNDVTLELQVTTDGGSTWKTSGYRYSVFAESGAGSLGLNASASAVAVFISWPGGAGSLHGVGNKTGGSYQATIRIGKPGATDYPKFDWQAGYDDGNTTPDVIWASGAGKYATAGAINGIRILASSGNISAAHVMLEAKRKS